MSDVSQENVRSEFIEMVGIMTQADGMPRIAGRVFGLFLFDGETRSFGDISKELNVSRGSVSSATKLLEQRNLIRRVCFSGSREVHFQPVKNPFAQMLREMADGMEKSASNIKETAQKIDPQNTNAISRITEFADFHEKMADMARRTAEDL